MLKFCQDLPLFFTSRRQCLPRPLPPELPPDARLATCYGRHRHQHQERFQAELKTGDADHTFCRGGQVPTVLASLNHVWC